MGPKSRFDCQDRDENRVSSQLFCLADQPSADRFYVATQSSILCPRFFTAWGVFCLSRLTGLAKLLPMSGFDTQEYRSGVCEYFAIYSD